MCLGFLTDLTFLSGLLTDFQWVLFIKKNIQNIFFLNVYQPTLFLSNNETT